MRRGALVLAGVALIAVTALAVAAWLQPAAPQTNAERALALSRQMRCPDCQALSVAESHTNAAAAIRTEIERQVASGASDDEIRQHFVDQYGEWILLAPPEALVWWMPALGLVGGVGILAAWYRFGRSRRVEEPAAAERLRPADRQRIAEELESLDG